MLIGLIASDGGVTPLTSKETDTFLWSGSFETIVRLDFTFPLCLGDAKRTISSTVLAATSRLLRLVPKAELPVVKDEILRVSVPLFRIVSLTSFL